MDTLASESVAVKPARRTSSQIYQAIDKVWPDKVPPLSEAEAITAARLLYRRFYRARWYQERGRRVPRTGGTVKVKVTSGRRYNRMLRGAIYVNPPRGWHSLVHGLSHAFHFKLRPRDPGHGDNHRALEREMIEHVVSNGWLDGKLKPKPKVEKPKPDPAIVALDRVLARIKAWETRAKRAATALAKLRREEKKLQRRRQRVVEFKL